MEFNTTKSNKRVIYYDIIRIIACFFVLLNHTIGVYDKFNELSMPYWIVTAILFCLCKMAVPLFLLISGALLLAKTECLKDCYYKRVFHMARLLLIWSFIYKLFPSILYGYSPTLKDIIAILISIISTPASWHLWYLYTILAIYIMLPFIRKMTISLTKTEGLLFIAIWFIFSGIIPYYNAISVNHPIIINNNFSIPLIGGYIGVFIVGYIIKCLNLSKVHFLVTSIGFILSLFINVHFTYVYSAIEGQSTRRFDNGLIFPVLFCSVCLFVMIKYLCEKIVDHCHSSLLCWCYHAIELCSRCTLGIYIIHPLVLRLAYSTKMFETFFSGYDKSIFQTFLFDILIFIVCFICTYIIKNIPFLNKILVC